MTKEDISLKGLQKFNRFKSYPGVTFYDEEHVKHFLADKIKELEKMKKRIRLNPHKDDGKFLDCVEWSDVERVLRGGE